MTGHEPPDTGREPPAPPPERGPERGPERNAAPPGRSGAWRLALTVLVLATAVAAIAAARVVLPPVARAAATAAGWSADAAASGAGEVADVWTGWAGRLEAVAEESAGTVPVALPAPEGSASVLVTVADAGGEGVAFALFAVGPGSPATVMLAPADLLAILPGYGDFRLAQAVQFEGPELAALTLTNLLGVRVDHVLGLGPGDLERALGGPAVLDLPTPLIVAQGDEGQVLAASGRAERPAVVVEAVLTTPGVGDPLEWLERQGAVWEAVLAAAAAEPQVAGRLAALAESGAAEIEAVLAAAAGAGASITAVPVGRVAVGGEDVRYTLDADGEDFVAGRLGHLAVRDGPRPRVEVLNGNGRVGTTRVVAEQLVERGFRVVRTDNADRFDYELTQVVAQGRVNRVAAQAVLDMIGSGELLLELRNPSGLIDISIIVGQDVPAGESG